MSKPKKTEKQKVTEQAMEGIVKMFEAKGILLDGEIQAILFQRLGIIYEVGKAEGMQLIVNKTTSPIAGPEKEV